VGIAQATGRDPILRQINERARLILDEVRSTTVLAIHAGHLPAPGRRATSLSRNIRISRGICAVNNRRTQQPIKQPLRST
jgi:hypothetical protein